ncbi:hypothetical protein [Halogeometricum sp. CBA1124]|uniref:hypothetical protein n=1 Tax=Halogeometricum sp. CBA1124 TaxID=2668071 RepID=UPI00142AB4C4|nr:hypothetical protein [Halogeometricum sp. CBA1124]MUV57244.1 hypothetical protein [Halogeometricum sp. CBA1124]
MYRVSPSSLRRIFYPLGLSAAGLTVLLVSGFVDVSIGIRGFYVVFGILLGAVVYYNYDTSVSWRVSDRLLRWSSKGVYLVFFASIVTVVLIERRLLVLLTLLPLGYLLLAFRLMVREPTKKLLPEIVALFTVPPLSKYLTTGFYFGDGDILFHILHVNQLLSRGTAAAIHGPVDQYRVFPGYHLLVGNLHLFTDLSVYDSILSLGIITYSLLVIPLLFLLSQVVLRRLSLSLSIALGASLVYSISYHTTYLFPQSLVVPLLSSSSSSCFDSLRRRRRAR